MKTWVQLLYFCTYTKDHNYFIIYYLRKRSQSGGHGKPFAFTRGVRSQWKFPTEYPKLWAYPIPCHASLSLNSHFNLHIYKPLPHYSYIEFKERKNSSPREKLLQFQIKMPAVVEIWMGELEKLREKVLSKKQKPFLSKAKQQLDQNETNKDANTSVSAPNDAATMSEATVCLLMDRFVPSWFILYLCSYDITVLIRLLGYVI